ncbi:DNA-binding XRE family transcriptional regulator [Tenacibaculum skagerrakense]|uniref:DNA-binding XRE family transcriptional regulator n=1 Tax=Tenacibaculum skagerrakense TaxID=186571 RepID=A0A4R2NXP7_9FLAO|nr:helix-turn-helix transcriptional regulator [Tenacibaculum skagerrakense]TCP26983.1 DNA-binding XRE family transcriptional regulator [Tenacibaculum skagerrakense]
MSFFGRNIKKIRGVKGLSQKAFAELFDLKRATLGAYEEGRSEPRIETIIKIANYFSITIDSLLTSDLTVNELLRFKDDLLLSDELEEKEQMLSIKYVSEKNISSYTGYFDNDAFLNDLPEISLPIESEKLVRAFTVTNLEMTDHDKGLYPKDVVIAEQIAQEDFDNFGNGEIVIAVLEKEIVVRKIYFVADNVILKAAHKNIEERIFPKASIKELWHAKFSFIRRLPEVGDDVENKLLFLERELLKLKNNS